MKPLVKAKEGIGRAQSHHGEILQGIFFDSNNRLHYGLVTLPWRDLWTMAHFLTNERDSISVERKLLCPEVECFKACHAAELTSLFIVGHVIGGTITIESSIPVGRGLGSSTADVVATIRAVAEDLDTTLTNYEESRLAVQAERASDATMFMQNAVLFAQREGQVLTHFDGPLPLMSVLGIDIPDAAPVNTLDVEPPTYLTEEIEAFRVLHGLLSYAIRMQEVNLVGRVATASAHINQRYLPKPHFEHVETIAQQTGAIGIQVAHSGTVMGLLFDRSQPDVCKRRSIAQEKLKVLGFRTYNVSL